MKYLITSFFVILVTLTSTTANAWVDCKGLSSSFSSNDFRDEKSMCLSFQRLYGNTDRDWVSEKSGIIRRNGVEWNGGPEEYIRSSKAKAKVETMSIDEIRLYKFDKAENGKTTTKKTLIAKTLIEEYDLWTIFSKVGGIGIRLKLEGLGLGGNSKTNYRPHTGNIFVYMDNNFTALEFLKLVKVGAKELIAMEISLQDILEGKISSEKLSIAYGEMLKKMRETNGVSAKSMMALL